MKIHIVQKGDTLWKIAQKYGVDFEELKQLNSQLSNPDMIMPGMKVKVPSTGVQVKAKEAPFSPSQLVKEKPVKEKVSPVKEAPVQPIKEAPVAPIQPVKEAPVAPIQPVKEAPVAPIQEVEEPFVDLSPEPLPVVEGVQDVPKAPIAPKLPYAPKLPQLPQFEMDINNYYLNVDANFLKGAPAKQPTAVSPAVDVPKAPKVPKVPQVSPQSTQAPVAPISPIAGDECMPVTGINPGYGFNFNPFGPAPMQPQPGFMQPQQGFMPQPGYPTMVSPLGDDELDDMPEMPPYPGASPLPQQLPMGGMSPLPQQLPMGGMSPLPQQLPMGGMSSLPQQMPMGGMNPFQQQLPMAGGNDCGCGGTPMPYGAPFDPQPGFGIGQPGYAPAPQYPLYGGAPGYGMPAMPQMPAVPDLDDDLGMPNFGGPGMPQQYMPPGYPQAGMQPGFMPQGYPQAGMPYMGVPQGFAPAQGVQPWGGPGFQGQPLPSQQPLQPGFAPGYPGGATQPGLGMQGYPMQGPLGMPDFDDDDDFNL
ncbi:SafA/ExsA family spore coat assembly protein [Bacillus suaedaesalsae]|uniref:SafA/ExsA family spore coat assembly protein n=1 Tax=Bacillus suaedaesalsae TaxID=2810349 RepID=A0ABS2DMN9_9BACI|nr:SafA/ExsA family spore coat assembly protein [Bacillus suaedaesalsae]